MPEGIDHAVHALPLLVGRGIAKVPQLRNRGRVAALAIPMSYRRQPFEYDLHEFRLGPNGFRFEDFVRVLVQGAVESANCLVILGRDGPFGRGTGIPPL